MNNQEIIEQMIRQNIFFMKMYFNNLNEDQRVIAYEKVFKKEMKRMLIRLDYIEGIKLDNFRSEKLDYKRLINLILEPIPENEIISITLKLDRTVLSEKIVRYYEK